MSTTLSTAGPDGYRYRWMVLVVVMVADVMDLLDATIANLAGPSIRHDIGGSETTLQWVLAAYTLTFAVGLITSARAGDLLGRRQLFIAGMVGFTVSSLLCGLAPSAGLLIAARVAQGFFGAVMIPQGLAMVKSSFTAADLQKAFMGSYYHRLNILNQRFKRVAVGTYRDDAGLLWVTVFFYG